MPLAQSRRSFVLLAALFALRGIGCDSAAPRKPVLITATPWIGNVPLVSAREQGFFGETEVRMIDLSTDFDAWRAIHEKRAAMSTGTLIDIIRSNDHGASQSVILALDYSRGADGIIGREGIKSIRDLAGKKIAVEQATLTHFVLLRALDKAGMREEDVMIENLATDEAVEALNLGKVDAAALWEPLLTAAKKPGRNILFTSKEMPGEILDVLTVRADFLAQYPSEVENVIRGYFKAIERFESDSQFANTTVARLMGMPEDEATRALETVALLNRAQNQALFDRSSPQNAWHAYELNARFMEHHKMLRHPVPPPETMLNPAPLQRVLRQGQ